MIHIKKPLLVPVRYSILVLIALVFIPFTPAGSVLQAKFNQSAQAQAASTFYSPIVGNGADPSVVFKDGFYYYTQTTGNNVTVWKSETISGIAKGTKVVVWNAHSSGPECCNIWAPELFYSSANEKWYIYFAADEGTGYSKHRMYALESSSSDPMGSYTEKGKIYDSTNDLFAIDGTVMQKDDGTLYFIWSGKLNSDADSAQHLFIAPMNNPWTISGPRVLISSPTNSWENSVSPINEGPEAINRNGSYSVVYSANASWTDEYNLGIITNTDGDLLNPASWVKKPSPIFSKTSEVFGPGHGSFTVSPDGTEDWFIYHAAMSQGSGWNRNIRAQKFTWNADNTPNLGTPVPGGLSYPLPSGEGLTCSTCDTYHGWGSSASLSRVSGLWQHNSTSNTNSIELGGGWHQVFTGDVSQTNYTVSADAQWVATGTTASYPKYGIYAAYKDGGNYVSVFIDKNNKVLATYGVVNGVSQGWQNSTIKGRFFFDANHTLKVVKSGTSFAFYLDGKQQQSRSFGIANGQIGLVTEDTRVNYSNVNVTAR